MSSEIKVDTISENTSANGVAVDGVTLKDNGITASGDISFDGGSFVFNESSADKDFRIETNGNSSMFFVDGGNDAVIFNGGTSDFEASSQVIQIHNSGLHFSSGYGIQGGVNADRASINLTSGASGHIVFKANNSEVARISADGEMTKSLQPCFRIGSGTQNNISTSVNNDVVFDSEVFDIGNNFASNTFTAPVTGKYFLSVLIRLNQVDSASSYIQCSILGSNRNTTIFTFDNGADLNADADNVTISGSTVLDMDANDTSSVRIRIQGGTAQADLDADGSYFVGYLIG
jgi:hypothetical protein